VTLAGLSLGYWLRYASPLARLGIDVPGATYALYLPPAHIFHYVTFKIA
jgi:hypothetical protein